MEIKNKIVPIETAKVSFKEGRPYSEKYKDFYFSSHGAISEKNHVFIEGNNLKQKFQSLEEKKSFVIAEIGFGLAINFLLSWQLWQKEAPQDKQLHFISTEINPLSKLDLKKVLKEFPELSIYAKQLLENYPILTPGFHRINFGNVSLTLLLGDANQELNKFILDFNETINKEIKQFNVNCWFFDGFSPSKAQKTWTLDLLTTVRLLSNKNTTISSYSVSKLFKNSLENSGFNYQKTAGIGNKKEFLIATYNEKHNPDEQKRKQASPWHCSTTHPPLKKSQSIAVIGAGLAGSIMAYRLAERGFKVTLFEKNQQIAQQGSGNLLGLVHFTLSAFHSPLNDFMLHAYLYALRFYQSLDKLTANKGIADLLSNEKFLKKQKQLSKFSNNYPEVIQFLTAEKISEKANINISKPGIYWPNALIISPIEICNVLTKHKNIQLVTNNNVDINHLAHDKIIICTGTSTAKITELNYLPLETVSGMVSYFPANPKTQKLNIGITNKGYITPAINSDHHIVGGSYHIENIKSAHQQHLNYAIDISNIFKQWQAQTPLYKQGTRAKTFDYLPYVGELFNVEDYNHHYNILKKDKNLHIKKPFQNKNNKFILTGFGSHGLTTIPLAVEVLLSQLLNEPLPISNTMLKSLSPARVLIKRIIKNA